MSLSTTAAQVDPSFYDLPEHQLLSVVLSTPSSISKVLLDRVCDSIQHHVNEDYHPKLSRAEKFSSDFELRTYVPVQKEDVPCRVEENLDHPLVQISEAPEEFIAAIYEPPPNVTNAWWAPATTRRTSLLSHSTALLSVGGSTNRSSRLSSQLSLTRLSDQTSDDNTSSSAYVFCEEPETSEDNASRSVSFDVKTTREPMSRRTGKRMVSVVSSQRLRAPRFGDGIRDQRRKRLSSLLTNDGTSSRAVQKQIEAMLKDVDKPGGGAAAAAAAAKRRLLSGLVDDDDSDDDDDHSDSDEQHSGTDGSDDEEGSENSSSSFDSEEEDEVSDDEQESESSKERRSLAAKKDSSSLLLMSRPDVSDNLEHESSSTTTSSSHPRGNDAELAEILDTPLTSTLQPPRDPNTTEETVPALRTVVVVDIPTIECRGAPSPSKATTVTFASSSSSATEPHSMGLAGLPHPTQLQPEESTADSGAWNGDRSASCVHRAAVVVVLRHELQSREKFESYH